MANETRPNVVLIMTDDLNDYTTELGGHPQAKTPNLTRLAETGVSFHSAYASNPICSPSRSSFFSGLHCHTSGHFYFDPWFHNETLVNTKMIPEHFGDNGYRTMGTGKLLHHLRRELWEDYGHRDNYGPFAFNGNEPVAHPSVPEPFRSIGFVDGGFGPLSDVPVVPATDDAPGAAGWYDKPQWDVNRPLRYVSEDDRDPTPDERCTQWAVEQIEALSTQPQDRPFFLGVGYIRPHTPLHAPKRFFDMFRIDDIELPVTLDGDADDTHYLDVFPDSRKGPMHFRALMESYPTRKEALRAYIQAYLACVACVDEEIGKVIYAIDHSPSRDNTIVVMTSDNGYNMGEKDYLFKDALWEESDRVPLIVRAPGLGRKGGVVDHPVSLVDIYPTLVDLCGLEGDTRKSQKGQPLDGTSLVPFLRDPDTEEWQGPEAALSVIQADGGADGDTDAHHYSVRTKRWRYILYSNGAEELYDHENDPYEWHNLEHSEDHTDVKAELRAMLLRLTGRSGP